MNRTTEYGQYFTKDKSLKQMVYDFIKNEPTRILEPSIGRGDLVQFITSKLPDIIFDMCEIDDKIKLLSAIDKSNVIYDDFLKHKFKRKYQTIIGNPPYVKMSTGNLYIDFISKCYSLLRVNGELIFIVPTDFIKLTSASALIDKMILNGTFTHIYHPNDERLFEDASIDVMVFRYCKDKQLPKQTLYNNKLLYLLNSNGIITFSKDKCESYVRLSEYFDIYVGLVSGRECVYKHSLGNIDVLNSKNHYDKYIYINKFPCDNDEINNHLQANKATLLDRKIKKFNENNWYQWGAPRNIKVMEEHKDKDCIYIHNLTRRDIVAFKGKVGYFGGALLMIKPKKQYNLNRVVMWLNSNVFKSNYIYSGRFKIGHRQLVNALINSSNIT